MATQNEQAYKIDEELEEEENEEEPQDWDGWDADGGEEDLDSDFLCLFCDSKYNLCDSLFEHCISTHYFDFHAIRKALDLDFYGSFKLINYVRSQVAEQRCWNCGLMFQSNRDLRDHLHETFDFKGIKSLWDDSRYLKPFMQDDSLLYSFGDYEEGEDDQTVSIDKEELMRDLMISEEGCIDENTAEKTVLNDSISFENGRKEVSSVSNGFLNRESFSNRETINATNPRECISSSDKESKDRHLRPYFPNHDAKDIKNVNENYFGSYSSFGIHREMLSDKVRMDAYRQAILENQSLINGAVVMDVGCGTGILSLFAARAGASRVIAVEASKKMAAVASQIAKDNGLCLSKSQTEGDSLQRGVIEVVQGMVEEIDKSVQIQPHSVDVLISEWMGYCLLFESMLSSVLFARDRWLKPGGAILPDTATIIVAGFGKGATSLPFWENVCGFDMSSIGKELVEHASKFPIIDVVDYQDIVTTDAVLQTFDLATMKPHQMDFTASAMLEPKFSSAANDTSYSESKLCWCYGLVLWFETGFTSRFCREKPAVLSTSPYTPNTHWSQTILTFREPIAMGFEKGNADSLSAIGTDASPAVKINLRISIVRSTEHRSIDISLETAGVDAGGRRRSWPAQLFSLR